MKALVVFESLWGNTATIAHAIAEGVGQGTQVLSTADADPVSLDGFDLLIVGAPTHLRGLPSDKSKVTAQERWAAGKVPEPDLARPALQAWLEKLDKGQGSAAAFDTRSGRRFGGGAAPVIAKKLKRLGFSLATKPEGFLVEGQGGPLREGELERARQWGASIKMP